MAEQMDNFDALLNSFGGEEPSTPPSSAPESQADDFESVLKSFDGEIGASPTTDFSNVDFTPIPRRVEGNVPRDQGLFSTGQPAAPDVATTALVGTGVEAERSNEQFGEIEQTLYMTQTEFNRASDAGTLPPNSRVNIISEEEKDMMDRGIEVDKPVNAFTRFMIGWFGAGREDVKRQVTSRLLNSDVVSVDGNMVRLVPQKDGSKKPMLVNSLGATGEDIAEFAGEELLPFFLGGTTGLVTGATATAATRNRAISGVSAAIGDSVGVFVARNAQIEMAKSAGLLDESQFPTEEIWSDFSSPATQEAMYGLIGTLGVSGTLQFLSTSYRLVGGKSLPKPTVDHLRNVLTEYEKVNAEKIQPWRQMVMEGADPAAKAPKGPTVGQATGDDFVLNLEARAKELKQDPSSFTTDPFRKQENRDALAISVSDYVQRKYGQFSGDETVAQAESILLANLRRPHEDMITSIGSLKQSVDRVIERKVGQLSGEAPTAQDLVGNLRQVAKDTRDQIDQEFSNRYAEVAEKYKGLTGPNTHLAELKQNLTEEQQGLLETYIKGTRARFLREQGEAPDISKAFVNERGEPLFFVGDENLLEKTMRPGATLSYEEVDATLKALRAKRRQMKDSGADAAGPDIATLDRLIGAYKAQRADIAGVADDGGRLLQETDTALAVAKGQVDNRVVREILKTTNGSYDRQAENVAEYIFRGSKGPLQSVTGDVTGQLMGIVRKDPQLMSKFRMAVSDVYAREVKSAAEHKEFMHQYGGIIQDVYGEVPRSIKSMKKAFERSEELDGQLQAAVTALQEETLLKASPGRIIERVLESGTIEEQSKILRIVEEHPDLKRMYLRTYMGGLLTGSVAGKGKGILRIDEEGNRYFDVGRLREIVGARGEGVQAHQDPIFRRLLDEDTKKLFEDTVDIVEMTNRGVKMSETEKYRKSLWAHAIQLYLGPLTKGTRFSNAADLYLQRESGRALVKALTDPDEFRKLVKAYEPTTKTEAAFNRSALSLLAREFGYNDQTNKPNSDDEFFKDLLQLTPAANLAAPSVTPSEEGEGEGVQSPSEGENVPQGATQEASGGDGRVKPVSEGKLPDQQPTDDLSPTDDALSANPLGGINRDQIVEEIKRRAATPEAFQ